MVTFRGFRGSPVSKGLLIATSVTSVYYLSSFSKHVKAPALLSLLAFPDPGALLLGSGLLYQSSTTLERQSGSQKHLSFVIVMQGLHAALMTLSRGSAPATTGPLPFIFASLTLYLLDTPSTQHFTLMGMRLTDKVSEQVHTQNMAGNGHFEIAPLSAYSLLVNCTESSRLDRMLHEGMSPAWCRSFLSQHLFNCCSYRHTALFGRLSAGCCLAWCTGRIVWASEDT